MVSIILIRIATQAVVCIAGQLIAKAVLDAVPSNNTK